MPTHDNHVHAPVLYSTLVVTLFLQMSQATHVGVGPYFCFETNAEGCSVIGAENKCWIGHFIGFDGMSGSNSQMTMV